MEMKSNIIYPDAPMETSYDEAMEYQDFVADILCERLGIVVTNYSSRRYQINRGESKQGIEIKLDKRIVANGNVSIEVYEKSKARNEYWIKSGILRDDNTWLYVQGNYDYIFIFSKKVLIDLYEKQYKDYVWEPKSTIKTFLLPFNEAKKNCHLFIEINEDKELEVENYGGVKMEKSESIKEIALALSMFQGEVLNPKSISINPNFNSKYAPLCEVINTVKETLTKYGLSILQIPYTEGDRVSVETFLMHNSGEWIKSPPLSFKIDNLTAQGAGAAITYARRYSLSAMLNISSEEDLDGNHSDDFEINNEEIKVESQPIVDNNNVTEKQIKFIHTLAKEKGVDNPSLKNLSKTMFGKESSKNLTKQEASSLIEALQILKIE